MKKIATILFLLLGILSFSYSQSIYVIETNVDDLKITQNNGNDVISLVNSISSDSVGNPMLPLKQLKVAIPSNNEVSSISIVDIQEQEINGEYNIGPTQEPEITGTTTNLIYKKNDKVYNSNRFYPTNPLLALDRGNMSGVNIFSLNYYPIKYNPVTKKIRIITRVTFKLNYLIKQEKENISSSNLSNKSYNYLMNNIKNLVINPTEVGSITSSKLQKVSLIQKVVIKPVVTTIDYVIITNESLKNGFQEIADWKTKTGLTTKIVTTEWISQTYSGSDIQEKIRTFIKYAYQNWGAIWYLLGGGNQIVPVRYAWISHFNHWQIKQYNSQGVFIPSDMYYSCLDGSWNADGDMTYGEGDWNRSNNGTFVNSGYNIDNVDRYCDVFIGRIPVENSAELTRFKTKYFEYLNGTNVNTSKVLLFSANSDAIYSSEMNNVASYFPNTISVDKLYECIGGYQSSCGTKSDVLNGFNSNTGYQIICGYGHGSPQGFEACVGSINNEEIDALQNAKRGQILYNNHCETLALDKDCIGEHYMSAINGGVAYIGNTHFGWTGDPSIYNNQFIANIYQSKRLGESLYNAKGTGSVSDGTSRWGFFALNLLGDPEMPVWTNTPKIFSVSGIPNSVICGNSTITITVNNLLPNEQALISLRKGEELNTTSIVNASSNSYTFNVNTKTVGQIEITITSQNYIPTETTIPVTVSPNENLYISSIAIDDDMSGSSNGNGNLQIDAGETIELTVELTNNGQTTANNVVANISSTSSYVSLISNQSNFGTILSNNSAFSLSKFVFLIDKNTPELLKDNIGAVKFNLQISDGNGNSFADAFNVDIRTSEIKQGNKTIVSTGNGNLSIDPNEIVTLNIDLRNIGNAEARGLTAILTGNSSDITPRSYPNIAPLEAKNNISVFQFTTGANVPNPLTFHLKVENEYGKIWDLPDFNLLDRPNQVENLGFTADVSEINLSWNPITNTTIEGYNIYRCNLDVNENEIGSYVKLNNNPVSSTFYNDVNLGVLTKYRYKVSAVSITGNEGDCSLPYTAWTSKSKEVYPLSFGPIRGGITAADINNDGFKEIFGATKQGYIIGLDHECKELYDIDDNITTQGAYASMQTEVWGTPAVGDLQRNGQIRLVDASVNAPTNRIYCFSGNNTFQNNNFIWRNNLPAGTMKGTVLSNIDNSPDGSFESIVACVSGPNAISIYNTDGSLRTTINCDGSWYDGIAVADIDGAIDGCKEIIRLVGSSIYVWNYDGSPYNGINPIYYTLPSGFTFQGSPIVCNINNSSDGKKEILASATTGSISQIYAIRSDIPTLVTGWNTPSLISNGSMAVGDLNHDGNLEIVSLGSNTLSILMNNGSLSPTQQPNPLSVNDLSPAGNPILADLDDDSDVEIVFGSTSAANKNIYVYNYDLTRVLGFPVNTGETAWGTPCVSDIDKDGKNELILGVNNSIYLWRTNGNPDNIEWGSDRHDQYNTGEYYPVCEPTYITTSTTWSNNQSLCNDLVIKSGNLTINNNSNITMTSNSMVIVMAGATLTIDSGRILNCNVKVLAGGTLILRNNGVLDIRNNGEFNVEQGAIFENQYGSIE